MVPPVWLDERGRRRPTMPCWTCGREVVATVRFRDRDVRALGWQPGGTVFIPAWCGCRPEYVPVPEPGGWWRLVRLWDPEQPCTPVALQTPPGTAPSA
jgi:hypothetical protein